MSRRTPILVALLAVVATATAGVAMAAPPPQQTQDGATYTLSTGSIDLHPGGTICAEKVAPNVNKVTVTNATMKGVDLYLGDKQRPKHVHAPSADVDKIVLYTNGDNREVDLLATAHACIPLSQHQRTTLHVYYQHSDTLTMQGFRMESAYAGPVPKPGGLRLPASITNGSSNSSSGNGSSPVTNATGTVGNATSAVTTTTGTVTGVTSPVTGTPTTGTPTNATGAVSSATSTVTNATSSVTGTTTTNATGAVSSATSTVDNATSSVTGTTTPSTTTNVTGTVSGVESTVQNATSSLTDTTTSTTTVPLTTSSTTTSTTTTTTTTTTDVPPVAGIHVPDQVPVVGQLLTMSGSPSSDSDGSIVKYQWDWNDDGTWDATGKSASHTFTSPGDHTVKLRVTDDAGKTDTVTKTINVDAPPTASVSVLSDVLQIGSPINFDATGSSDPDGNIVKYQWDWNDDGTWDATGATPSHTFSTVGSHTIKLRVTDDRGVTDTVTKTIDVTDGLTGSSTNTTTTSILGG